MSNLFAQITTYSKMIKISHTLFAMPFAVSGIAVAIAHQYRVAPDGVSVYGFVGDAILIVIAVAFARSVAMGVNRVVDSGIDRRNPRTAGREIPSGQISNSTSMLFITISAIGYGIASLLLSPLCFVLSPIPVALFVLYAYSKRFTALCHFILGLSLAIAPIGAFIAITGTLSWGIILLGSSVLVWTAGFDIIYALQDMSFDRSERLHSVPSILGRNSAVGLSRLLHALFVALLILSGVFLGLGAWFYMAVLFASALIVWQHVIAGRDNGNHGGTNHLMQAFNVNIYISIAVMVGVLLDILL